MFSEIICKDVHRVPQEQTVFYRCMWVADATWRLHLKGGRGRHNFCKEFNILSFPFANVLLNAMRHLKSRLQLLHAIKTTEESIAVKS